MLNFLFKHFLLSLDNVVDEDEGSCLQRRVYRIAESNFNQRMSASQAKNLEIGKIERSAEALRVCHHPMSFPPKTTTKQYHAGNRDGQKMESGCIKMCETKLHGTSHE